jgi:alpha-L-fucosidase 2
LDITCHHNEKKLIPVYHFLFSNICYHAQNKPLKLWYNKPATQWEETLPLGNGHLGMMPDGGDKGRTYCTE